MTDMRFLAGFLAGFVVAGVLGFLMQRIRFARRRISDFGSPQSVRQNTNQTPAQILMGCISGALAYLVWLALFVLFLGAVGWFLYSAISSLS